MRTDIELLEAAAKSLNPVILSGCTEHAKVAHDVLNILTILRIRAEVTA